MKPFTFKRHDLQVYRGFAQDQKLKKNKSKSDYDIFTKFDKKLLPKEFYLYWEDSKKEVRNFFSTIYTLVTCKTEKVGVQNKKYKKADKIEIDDFSKLSTSKEFYEAVNTFKDFYDLYTISKHLSD